MISTFFKKTLKFFLYSMILLALFIAALVLWPLAEIKPPDQVTDLLIKNANIVDVKTGEIIENRNILIANGLIKSIHESGELAQQDLRKIDAAGKYVIPGLWDMHSHSTQLSPWMHHPLQIVHGVTGVREMSGNLGKRDSYWAGASDRVEWNKEVSNNDQVAPRFVLQSSFQLDGAASIPDSFPSYYRLDKPEDVEPLLSAFQEQGVDQVKVYFQIPADSYRELARKAGDYDIHLAGHKPIYIDLSEAIELGQKSFEHARIFFLECDKLYEGLHGQDWKQTYLSSKSVLVNDCDHERTYELMRKMAEYQAHWVPTLLTVKVSAFAHDETFIDHADLDTVMYLRRKLMWEPDIKGSAKRNQTQGSNNINLQLYRKAQEQVGKANELGVAIMAGTDVTDTNNFTGLSLHYELADLVESGLTPLEALQSATIVSAKYAGLDDLHGSVQTGKYADLILLDANPLDDIKNSQKIDSVILNGVYYDAEELEKLKLDVEQRASSWHMNAKFLYGLFASPLMRRQLVD